MVVSRYRVDAGHGLTLVDRSVQPGSAVCLSAALPGPGIGLIAIDPATAATAEQQGAARHATRGGPPFVWGRAAAGVTRP